MSGLSKDKILDIATSRGGFFTVDRYTYRHEKLRKKVIKMGKDSDCPLNFYSSTKSQLIFSV